MADGVSIIRFPDGSAEFFAGTRKPTIGDSLARYGRDWKVTRVDDTTVGLRISVIATEVVRDDSWPSPYEFFRP